MKKEYWIILAVIGAFLLYLWLKRGGLSRLRWGAAPSDPEAYKTWYSNVEAGGGDPFGIWLNQVSP
jgi:hypothetical protein